MATKMNAGKEEYCLATLNKNLKNIDQRVYELYQIVQGNNQAITDSNT